METNICLLRVSNIAKFLIDWKLVCYQNNSEISGRILYNELLLFCFVCVCSVKYIYTYFYLSVWINRLQNLSSHY